MILKREKLKKSSTGFASFIEVNYLNHEILQSFDRHNI